MNEIWKDVVGYEGLYQVSNLGRVKSIRKNLIMSTPINATDGYSRVNLKRKGQQKQCLVHRLVGAAFIDNPNNLPLLNHINENKSDNRVENLEWCDKSYNMHYGTCIERISKKLSKPILCVELGIIFDNAIKATEFLGLSKGTATHINRCAIGKEERSGGFHWRYM